MPVAVLRQWTSLAALALFAAISLAAPVALGDTAAKNRVVMQVSDDDPGKWNLALNNARNLQSDLGARNVAI
ncbi:MAG TPA: hypothetical protein VGL96_01875, partial [Casimicrobiaceae bacterium]